MLSKMLAPASVLRVYGFGVYYAVVTIGIRFRVPSLVHLLGSFGSLV